MNESLKFDLRYKFIKRETRGLELRSRPLIPLFKSLVCLQLRDEVEVKTPRTFKGHATVLRTACGLLSGKCQANFKIYERAYHGSKFSAKRSAA